MLRLVLVALFSHLILRHVAGTCNTHVLNGIRTSLTNDCWAQSNSRCWNGNFENYPCSDGVWKNCLSRWTAHLAQHCNPVGIPACTAFMQALAVNTDTGYAAHCASAKPTKSHHCTYSELFHQFDVTLEVANNEPVCDEDICNPESEQCQQVVENMYQSGIQGCSAFPIAMQPMCEQLHDQTRSTNLQICNTCRATCLSSTPPIWPSMNNEDTCYQ